MDPPGMSCKTKGSLGEQEISDLFSDELSEVPSRSDSEGDWGKAVNFSPVIQSESDSESSSKESAGTAT
jgi:hypothetical protein